MNQLVHSLTNGAIKHNSLALLLMRSTRSEEVLHQPDKAKKSEGKSHVPSPAAQKPINHEARKLYTRCLLHVKGEKEKGRRVLPHSPNYHYITERLCLSRIL